MTLQRERIAIFLCACLFFLLCAAGYIDTYDATPSVRTAESLVKDGRLGVELENPNWHFFHLGRYGLWYTKMGLVTPLLYLFPTLVTEAVSEIFHSPHTLPFLISLVNPIVAALIALLLFDHYRCQLSFRESLLLVLITCLGTLIWPYSKSCHRDLIQGFFLLCAFVLLSKDCSPKKLAMAGLALGAGVLTKQAFLVPALGVFLLMGWNIRGTPKKSLYFLIPFLATVSLWGVYGEIAWANPSYTGYSLEVTRWNGGMWQTPFWTGVWFQWISLSKGLIWYSPLLLLLLRLPKLSSLEFCVLLSTIFQTAFYARWFSPAGGQGLGPRYLVVILPALCLLFRSLPWRRMGPLAYGVVTLSLFLQTANASVKIQQYHTVRHLSQSVEDPPLPHQKRILLPHWVANLVFAKQKLMGEEEKYEARLFGKNSGGRVDVSHIRSLQGFNYWWLHLLRIQNPNTLEKTTQKSQTVKEMNSGSQQG